jgi:hypothetical protein
MHRYTVYLHLETALHVSGGNSTIITSAKNCINSIWYLSHRYCYLPLSWKSWNLFESAVNHQERKQLYLEHLVFVTPLLLPAAIVEEMKTECSVHNQERKQLYLQRLVFVTSLLLSTTIVEELEPV